MPRIFSAFIRAGAGGFGRSPRILEDDRAVAEAGDDVEFSAEGFDESAEGAELQIILVGEKLRQSIGHDALYTSCASRLR